MVKLHLAKKYFLKSQDFNPRIATIRKQNHLLATKTVLSTPKIW